VGVIRCKAHLPLCGQSLYRLSESMITDGSSPLDSVIDMEYVGGIVNNDFRDLGSPHFFISKNTQQKKGLRPTTKPLVNHILIDRFVECCETIEWDKIVVCYHGTDIKNVESIETIGLVVPGRGDGSHIKVAHASSYGWSCLYGMFYIVWDLGSILPKSLDWPCIIVRLVLS
jgi:hypothetical protein